MAGLMYLHTAVWLCHNPVCWRSGHVAFSLSIHQCLEIASIWHKTIVDASGLIWVILPCVGICITGLDMFSFFTIALTLLVFALQIRFLRNSHYLIGVSRPNIRSSSTFDPPCSHPQWCWKTCHLLSDRHHPPISMALSILFKSILKTMACKLSSPYIRWRTVRQPYCSKSHWLIQVFLSYSFYRQNIPSLLVCIHAIAIHTLSIIPGDFTTWRWMDGVCHDIRMVMPSSKSDSDPSIWFPPYSEEDGIKRPNFRLNGCTHIFYWTW